ncbi:SlyX family protein [uncultured Tateyamaria sp.]|uniref:SlyX family protein n=1 Tax=Tateyamaria sp. 1078 TaxID=3417464 RepID=UPI002625C40D|nr:SlyX family protein [uncultured Tateyamaria sp.]
MTQLEERIAHLERAVEDLSDVVARQDAEIARLIRQADILIKREAERDAAGTGGVVIGDERPPHY